MSCGACGCGTSSRHLCPFSLGAAIGITCFLTMFIGALWFMHTGIGLPMMINGGAMPSIGTILMMSLWGLVKGFLFGFVVALIYDFFVCCVKGHCKKKACQCACCNKSTEQSPK